MGNQNTLLCKSAREHDYLLSGQLSRIRNCCRDPVATAYVHQSKNNSSFAVSALRMAQRAPSDFFLSMVNYRREMYTLIIRVLSVQRTSSPRLENLVFAFFNGVYCLFNSVLIRNLMVFKFLTGIGTIVHWYLLLSLVRCINCLH